MRIVGREATGTRSSPSARPEGHAISVSGGWRRKARETGAIQGSSEAVRTRRTGRDRPDGATTDAATSERTNRAFWSCHMKSYCKAAIVAAGFVVPAISFAQGNAPLTRAQVRAEQARYEQAGFNPARDNPSHWVDDLQAASARVNAERNRSMRTASGGANPMPTIAN
ncbi:DUF4148 domain-containing protein [Burkholderia sp. 22PA0099]|uniref:DUF4148 domain-containing protein n=1 Tax=Burkholderia sp. 22PA0099 TaxID=3237372 RepID=UPI0039C209E7